MGKARARRTRAGRAPRMRLALIVLIVLIGGAAVLTLALAAVWRWREADLPAPVSATAARASLTYVGSQACAACHASENERWRASQHADAMQVPNGQTALGDFNNAKFTYPGTTSTFSTRDGRFFVRTDGADGRLADFEIAYTFGLWPLQQYLVELPGGRFQALSIAWDARPSTQGGQRWFHLYPHEAIKAGDPLHWTGIRQNWNFMCADCHTTDLQKGYDPVTREFHTTWSEIGVGCEACHGPGSEHVARARAGRASTTSATGFPTQLDERRNVAWTFDIAKGIPERSRPRTSENEIEVCARCHSLRSPITNDPRPGDPLHNDFRVSLLDSPNFYADGQQQGEVYTYASFEQSRMHAAGVTCSDCHDPHSGTLRASGNATCTQCHLGTRYDATAHTMHQPGTAGASCVTCHMPTATFMGIDERHDHSLRVPRPDRTVTLGVPNACTSSCHQNRTATWAAEAIRRHSGRDPGGYQIFAEAFAAASRHVPGAGAQLLAIAADLSQPGIVRASAISRLTQMPATGSEIRAASQFVSDRDPLVRRATVALMAGADETIRRTMLVPLLIDPVNTVRIEAASAFADLADQALTGVDRQRFDRAFDELVAEQHVNADRPEAQTNLGQVLMRRGQLDSASAKFREAIRLDPTFVPAYVNQAEILRLRDDDLAAERLLREGLAKSPSSAPLHHALGLTLVREKRVTDALPELARAADLDPDALRYRYVYAVALHDTGRAADAIRVLEASVARAADHDTVLVLAMYLDESGRRVEAKRYAERLLAMDPADADARALTARLATAAR